MSWQAEKATVTRQIAVNDIAIRFTIGFSRLIPGTIIQEAANCVKQSKARLSRRRGQSFPKMGSSYVDG
jgi:hypothetical protein